MNIQWYPGHMTKTRRQIEADLKLVDIVVEISLAPDHDPANGSFPERRRHSPISPCDPAMYRLHWTYRRAHLFVSYKKLTFFLQISDILGGLYEYPMVSRPHDQDPPRPVRASVSKTECPCALK